MNEEVSRLAWELTSGEGAVYIVNGLQETISTGAIEQDYAEGTEFKEGRNTLEVLHQLPTMKYLFTSDFLTMGTLVHTGPLSTASQSHSLKAGTNSREQGFFVERTDLQSKI